jgi:hypothetical protein
VSSPPSLTGKCTVCGWTPKTPLRTRTGDEVMFLTKRRNLCNQNGCIVEYERRRRREAREAYFAPIRARRSAQQKRKKKKARAA